MKSRFQSKTMWLSALAAAFGAAQIALPTLAGELMGYHGWVTLGLAVAYAVLREITTQPVG